MSKVQALVDGFNISNKWPYYATFDSRNDVFALFRADYENEYSSSMDTEAIKPLMTEVVSIKADNEHSIELIRKTLSRYGN